jgi:hypothetical protein
MTSLDVIASGALHRMVFRAERGNLMRLLRRPKTSGLLAMTKKILWNL